MPFYLCTKLTILSDIYATFTATCQTHPLLCYSSIARQLASPDARDQANLYAVNRHCVHTTYNCIIS